MIVDIRRNENLIDEIKGNSNVNVKFYKLDIKKKTQIEAVFCKIALELEYIDVLVNCAGICDDTDVELEIATNLVKMLNKFFKKFNTTIEIIQF